MKPDAYIAGIPLVVSHLPKGSIVMVSEDDDLYRQAHDNVSTIGPDGRRYIEFEKAMEEYARLLIENNKCVVVKNIACAPQTVPAMQAQEREAD